MVNRGSGKTTQMMEKAVELLGEMPDNCSVFITGAHSEWLFELSQAFRDAGLMNVEFFTPGQIVNGCLRGRHGVLLIDDENDIPGKTRSKLFNEQKILKNRFLLRGKR